MATENTEPKGLGGWMILPLIGLFVMPIRLAVSLNNDFLPIFKEGYWEILTTPGTEAYHHLWGPLIIFETAGNLFYILFALILIFLFFTKSHLFPTLIIIYIATNLIFIASDLFISNLIPAIASESDPESIKDLSRTLIGAIIWIPYFMKSRRVKNTFVKRTPVYPLQPAETDGI